MRRKTADAELTASTAVMGKRIDASASGLRTAPAPDPYAWPGASSLKRHSRDDHDEDHQNQQDKEQFHHCFALLSLDLRLPVESTVESRSTQRLNSLCPKVKDAHQQLT